MKQQKVRMTRWAMAWCLFGVLAASTAEAQTGACCLGDASCVNTDSPGCTTLTGEFLGDGTNCASAVCTGACCLPAKQCTEGSRDDCMTGAYQGAGSACESHCAGRLGTAFTYQGQLKQGGVPLNDTIDVEVSLWTAAIDGDQVGATLRFDGLSGNPPPIEVVNGLFTVDLDFDAEAFNGNTRYLELAVRRPHDPSGLAAFTVLEPRQAVTPTPYAGFAARPWESDKVNVFYRDGDVGIGTADPQSALHVVGAENDGTNAALRIVSGSQQMLIDGNEVDTNTTVGLFLNNNVPHNVVLANGGGNVGIGATTPADKLHVAGGMLAQGSLRSASPDQTAEVFLGWGTDGDGNEMARIRIGGGGRGLDNGLDIQATGNRSLMRILHDGNVGIGTAAPQDSLHVVGNVLADGGVVRSINPNDPSSDVFLGWGADADGSDVARIRIGGDGPGATNGLDIQRTSNVSLMRIHHNGDVRVSGVLDIGIETLSEFCSGNACTVRCPSGKAALSGGCSTHCDHCGAITVSSPLECAGLFCSGDVPTGWYCEDDGDAGSAIVAHVVCARVK